MKKLIFSLFITMGLMMGVTAMAQDKTTIDLVPGGTKVTASLTAADTVVASDTYWVLTKSKKDYPATQDVLVKLTKVSGSPRVTVSFWGRKFTTSAWMQIESNVIWYATTADTTLLISTATNNRYSEYKTQLVSTATAQKSRLTKFELKEYY